MPLRFQARTLEKKTAAGKADGTGKKVDGRTREGKALSKECICCIPLIWLEPAFAFVDFARADIVP